ncbi:MAG: CHASE2 domain-containing protein [Betaproteobacteria bacterium]|nr:CHASE2 domain-containing protein [Betaproteobacteria bacterium]
MARLLRQRVIHEWLLIGVLLSLFSVVMVRGEGLARLDNSLYDQALKGWQRPAQSDVVLIGIDEDSLRQIGRWPWSRVVHATLTQKLAAAGARAVAFDVILTEPSDALSDGLLAEAMRANGRVVLPLIQQASNGAVIGEALPAPPFLQAAARLGHTSAYLDSDGIARAAYLRAGFGQAQRELLSLATLGVALPERAQAAARLGDSGDGSRARNTRNWVQEQRYQIPYAGPPGHFKTLSYVGVLRGDYAAHELQDKIVLVGMTANGLGDEFPVPFGGVRGTMSGIEIHANLLQGLREGIDLRLAPTWAALLLPLLLLWGLLLAFLWLSPRQSIVLTAGLCLATAIAAAVGLRYGWVWLSPALSILVMMLAYPLWSWRKLEATQRYLEDELNRLQQEPAIVPPVTIASVAPTGTLPTFVPDVIESRIAAVKAATQRLRSLNRFVASSLESLPAAALMTDFNGRVLKANARAATLFAEARDLGPLEGRDLFGLLARFQHELDGGWRKLWASVGADRSMLSVEVKDSQAVGEGGAHEYLLQIAPTFSHSGVQTGTIVTLTDVSLLHETERRRDEALRFLSHDMRAPQAGILTMLDRYRDDPDSITTEKLLARIGKYASRTLNLADDFLQLARAERIRSQDFTPLCLNDVMHDASDEAWALATPKGITLQVDAELDDAWVQGDKALLTRVLMNLLSNAIKYSPAHTRIEIRLSRQGANWLIAVHDQGYGMADTSRLFTRFTRLHHPGQPEEEGIGLGLVFVKTTLARHGGNITVTSKVAAFEGDSQGSVFRVSLPAIEPPVTE